MEAIFCGIPEWVKSIFYPCEPAWFSGTYNINNWMWSTVYILIKEYITVILQLILFTRVGTTPDLFTATLILFMMLVSFGFPFLSSYLFFVLRMGPFNKSVPDPRIPYPLGTIRSFIQVLLVITVHALAARTAAEFWKQNHHNWDSSGLMMTFTATNSSTGQMVSWLFTNNDKNTDSLPLVEEALNTFIFLIGLIHLMAADMPGELMLSAYFNDEKPEDVNATMDTKLNRCIEADKALDEKIQAVAQLMEKFTESNSEILQVVRALKVDQILNSATPAQKPTLNPMPPRKPYTRGTAAHLIFQADQESRPLLPPSNPQQTRRKLFHVPIPITFIVHVCILLAATSRAFPTAHGTPAISLYLYYVGFVDEHVTMLRIGGGFLGAIAALWYYYLWYVWPRNYQVGLAEQFVSKIIAPEPAFLYSELQLPTNMVAKNKMSV